MHTEVERLAPPVTRRRLVLARIVASITSVLHAILYLSIHWFYAVLLKKILVRVSTAVVEEDHVFQKVTPFYQAVFLDDFSFKQVLVGVTCIVLPIQVMIILLNENLGVYLGAQYAKYLRQHIMHASLAGALHATTKQRETSTRSLFDIETQAEQIKQPEVVEPQDSNFDILGERNEAEQDKSSGATNRHLVTNLLLNQLPLLEQYVAEVHFRRLDDIALLFFCTCGLVVFSRVIAGIATAIFLVLHFSTTAIEHVRVKHARKLASKSSRRLHKNLLSILRASSLVSMCNMGTSEEQKVAEMESNQLDNVIHYAKRQTEQNAAHHLFVQLIMPVVLFVTWAQLDNLTPSEAIETGFALLVCFLFINEVHKALVDLTHLAHKREEYLLAKQSVFSWLASHDCALDGDSSSLGAIHDATGHSCCCIPTSRTQIETVLQFDASSTDKTTISNPIGDIQLLNCTLMYQGGANQKIIRNMTYRFTAGTIYGIVGDSGIGKSTVCNMVAGMLEPSHGKIMFGDMSLTPNTKGIIRKHMAMVSQDTLLLERSIRENATYGVVNHVPDEFILETMKKLDMMSWLDGLHHGLDTVLDAGGEQQLSGGQRQRMQLVRIACQTKYMPQVQYVLLDECLSALDPTARLRAIEFLHEILLGRTAIIVTHHYDILSLCDTIVEFKLGGVMEEKNVSNCTFNPVPLKPIQCTDDETSNTSTEYTSDSDTIVPDTTDEPL